MRGTCKLAICYGLFSPLSGLPFRRWHILNSTEPCSCVGKLLCCLLQKYVNQKSFAFLLECDVATLRSSERERGRRGMEKKGEICQEIEGLVAKNSLRRWKDGTYPRCYNGSQRVWVRTLS